jgi:glyoxylase-like metal-dependent hydrolase (beta-lactamase superfamily II)
VLRDGRWVPTFPNAKYIFHKGEYAAWEESTKRGENRPGGGGNVWRYNCQPVVEAGQALLVDDDYQLDDTFSLTPTHGHSPCHCCVNIRSRGQHAVVVGDLMHHALQCREPDWSTISDWDPAQAARSRRKFLGETAGTGTFVLPIHFPHPTTGRVSGSGTRMYGRAVHQRPGNRAKDTEHFLSQLGHLTDLRQLKNDVRLERFGGHFHA